MILWRVSNYVNLEGTGGLYVSARWHTKGHPVIYCTLNPATALLETLVHIEIDADDRPSKFQVLRIEGPDTLSIEVMSLESLPSDWMQNQRATQEIGDSWLTTRRSLLLQVPSILVPETWNVIVNPMHSQANQLQIVKVYQHAFDQRFF